ncbi:DUF4157 domain-containing protein [Thalassomonas sp. RHCl1]|uniref:eCIS core domain-containing protein n=1 Tax=Thalassomonas sp. RHCl1 TaxID=2995320 RepID=UPI00248B2EB8|nr:DUF4157 domain-containing protein [Thalassomonas sp. RHCl1]
MPAPRHIKSAVEELNTKGTSISTRERAFFEPRFAKDFSQVKIHTGNHAEQLAAAINAREHQSTNARLCRRSPYNR